MPNNVNLIKKKGENIKKHTKIVGFLLIVMLSLISISMVSAIDSHSIMQYDNDVSAKSFDNLTIPENNTSSDNANTTNDDNETDENNSTDENETEFEDFIDDDEEGSDNVSSVNDDLLGANSSDKGASNNPSTDNAQNVKETALHQTGNPLLLLLTVFMVTCSIIFKREK